MAEANRVQELIQKLSTKEDLSWLGEEIEKVLAWRAEASSEKEAAQADEAILILTKKIPISLEARYSSALEMEKIGEIIRFGLELAKLAMSLKPV